MREDARFFKARFRGRPGKVHTFCRSGGDFNRPSAAQCIRLPHACRATFPPVSRHNRLIACQTIPAYSERPGQGCRKSSHAPIAADPFGARRANL
jgi:hypothetical protein